MVNFFQQAGNFGENLLKTDANVAGSIIGGAVGNPNLIPTMSVDENWQNVNRIGTKAGGIEGKYAAQFGLQTLGVPMGVTAAGQQAIGGATQGINNNQFNQPVQATQPPQPYYNTMNTAPQQSYAQTYASGGYVGLNPHITNGNLALGIYNQMKNYHANNTANNFDNYTMTQHKSIGGYIKGYQEGDYVTPNPFASQQTNPININQSQSTPSSFSPQSNYSNNFGNPNLGNPISSPSANTQGGNNMGGYAALGSAALGGLETAYGLYGLSQLNKQAIPTYGVSPQLQTAYSRAQQNAQMGYTPQEQAAFKTNLAENQNTAYQNAINQSGGNLGQAINAGLQSQNIGALNQFSAQDAALRRENQRYADQFAGQFQNIQNENTKAALQQRMLREQALGQATQAGLTNLAGAANAYLATGYKG